MKTLGKLKINSEKVLKNEELVNLKGGYGERGDCCWCTDGNGHLQTVMYGVTRENCGWDCHNANYAGGSWMC